MLNSLIHEIRGAGGVRSVGDIVVQGNTVHIVIDTERFRSAEGIFVDKTRLRNQRDKNVA
jgi:hypothetical protein